MNGDTVIVTGATGGIGSKIVAGFAARGYRVVSACRNVVKGEEMLCRVESRFPGFENLMLSLDLSSFDSVRAFVSELERRGIRPGILINNAGVICREQTLTVEGLETTVATNYMGVYLLTRLLLPVMQGDGRIINTVSCTYRLGRIDRSFFGGTDVRRYGRFKAYGNSKLALLLFTAELAERIGSHRVAAADPGVVDTGMITMGQWFDPLADCLFRPFIKKASRGADAALSAAYYSGNDAGGYIFHSGCRKKIPSCITGHPCRRWLWEETEDYFRKNHGINLHAL